MEQQAPITKDTPSNEINELIKLVGVYSNKFYASATKDGLVKLTFADEFDTNTCPVMCTQVVLTLNGLFTLNNFLAKYVQSINEKQQSNVIPMAKEEREKLQ
jgi:hypothetical protein